MQIAPDNINFLSESYFDPIGRVFFAKGRVFRAIESEYVQQTLDFLKSPLFEELQRRRWVVKTWESHDVQIEGYELILEHEWVKCISPSVWTFSQLKDALLFNMQIDELCQQYGSRLRDARYSNITFVNGKPIFVDFGSFVGDLECYLEKDFALLVYPPLFLYSKREFMLSRIWQEYALNYYRAKQIAPQSVLEDSILFRNMLSKRVKYYDVCIRQKLPHFRIFTECGIRMFKAINGVARKVLHKDSTWRLFKYETIYKQPSKNDIEKVQIPYTIYDSFAYPIERIDIDSLICDLRGIDIKTIMLYGNIDSTDVIHLSEQFNGNIIVASNDYIYTDQLYRKFKNTDIKIHVACINLLTESSNEIIKDFSADVIVINERLRDLSLTTLNSSYKVIMQCHRLGQYLYVQDSTLLSPLYHKGFDKYFEKESCEKLWKSI